jgi:hypothetical protein
MAAALAYIDAVKAAACNGEDREKCIVCEDVMWGEIDLDATVGRRLVIVLNFVLHGLGTG